MRAVVAGGEAERIDETRRILLSEGLNCEAEDAVGYDRLQDSLAAAHPDVVLVIATARRRKAWRRSGQPIASSRRPSLRWAIPDVALMREAMRAGAREYLNVNNLRRDLAAALATIETSHAAASKRGRLISVFSPVSGAGVTTVALNLAVSLARLHPPADAATAPAAKRKDCRAGRRHAAS